jgi:DNA gyrase/topoisomerase IV subunit A
MLKRNYYSRDDYERHKRLAREYRSFVDVRVDDPGLPQRIRNLITNEHTKENKFLQSFLPSILEQFEKKGYLTQKQVDILEKNEKQFDPMNVESSRKEYEEWCKEYDDEKREIAKKVAEYYKSAYESGKNRAFYHEKAATQILENPDYIPPKLKYEKMVNNKYAQQWLKNSSAQPKFNQGDYVSLNSQTKGYWNRRNFGGDFQPLEKFEIGTIIEVKPPVANRKGAHICVVLPMGGTDTVEIEERFLKKARGV